MPHTIYVEREGNYLVLGDYSGSPRHASLSDEAWKREFEADPAYDAMKASYPGAIAGVTLQGVGTWSRDWKAKVKVKSGCCK